MPSALSRFQDAFDYALMAPDSDPDSEVAALTAQPAFAVGGVTGSTPETGKLKICKLGNANGTFAVTNFAASPSILPTPTVATGACVVVAEDNEVGIVALLVVHETSAGFQSASIAATGGLTGTYADTVDQLRSTTFMAQRLPTPTLSRHRPTSAARTATGRTTTPGRRRTRRRRSSAPSSRTRSAPTRRCSRCSPSRAVV